MQVAASCLSMLFVFDWRIELNLSTKNGRWIIWNETSTDMMDCMFSNNKQIAMYYDLSSTWGFIMKNKQTT